jgi:myo-inositol 2-dehydrogenase / D-chiro-inositol 1-dehydrogenase
VTRAEPERPVRVAVVGAGVWGEQHARVFAAHPDAELVAIGGRTRERTEARARAYGVPAFVELEAMLERARPDLVTVCLPNEGHFEPTLALLRAGIPLLVEKPLVFELEQADALLAEAERHGTFFAINFNHRFAVPMQRAAEAVRDGRLGALVFATWRFGGEPGTSVHAHANLIETQCHGFDALELLCGPIDAVSAEMTDPTGRGFSTMALALHFANGAVGSLVGTYDSSYAYPATHHLEVNGTIGRLLVEDTVRRLTLSRSGSESREVWEAGYFNDRDREFHRTFDRHADALLAALRAGEDPPVHARAGRRALELAHAAIRSFEHGRRVAVTPP